MAKNMIKSPPLSFPGNKKNYKKEFLEELASRFDDTYTYVDLFGGSGYLSYMTKFTFPKARVIYNDYDDFSTRIENIDKTNKLIEHIRHMIGSAKYSEKLSPDLRLKILEYLRQKELSGEYVDYITLSSFLCFSNKLCDNHKEMTECYLYNRLKNKPLKCSEEYLKGLEIINDDYRSVYKQFKDEPKVVFIIDPPYLASTKRVYKNNYWRLPHYFEVLEILREADNWFFFTNDEGCLKELLEFIDTLTEKDSRKYMTGVSVYKRTSCCNYNAKFKDIMMIKGHKDSVASESEPEPDEKTWAVYFLWKHVEGRIRIQWNGIPISSKILNQHHCSTNFEAACEQKAFDSGCGSW